MTTSKIDHLARVIDHEQRSPIECGTCTACCRPQTSIALTPEERCNYRTNKAGTGLLIIKGLCSYVSAAGCTIYDKRPKACRDYDCRDVSAWGVVDDKLQALGQPTADELFKITGATDMIHEQVLADIGTSQQPGESTRDAYHRVLEEYSTAAKGHLEAKGEMPSKEYKTVVEFTAWIRNFTRGTK